MTNRAFGPASSGILHFEVLSDALSVEYVFALRSNRVFGLVIAQSADGTLRHLYIGHCGLGLQDQIGMTGHLSHPRDQGENVGIVVQHRSLVDVRRELPFGTGEQGRIQLFLGRGEVIPSDSDDSRWQSQIIGSLQLCSPQHHSVEEDFELLERRVARVTGFNTILGDRCENLSIPETNMFHGTMTTLVAMPLVAELPVERFAITSLTEVVTDSQ